MDRIAALLALGQGRLATKCSPVVPAMTASLFCMIAAFAAFFELDEATSDEIAQVPVDDVLHRDDLGRLLESLEVLGGD